MSQQAFQIGQRWISDTEAELGLGMVLDMEPRLVTLSFPAAGERRTYSINNAPITRVRYSVGDSVRSAEGRRLKITGLQELEGLIIYQGLDDAGKACALEEIDLDSFVQFSTPADRLYAGQVDSLKRFDLRLATLEQLRQQQTSPSYGLLGARVQLLAHQLYIASEVGRRYAPRVLLADEVGLGKTIEAGLIVHQQLINGRASRVLVLVPDSLVHQWLVEMLRRFNLQFSLFSAERLQDLAESGGNPFDSAQLVICPLSVMVQDADTLAQACACHWDLLLVDEAHHLTWAPDAPGRAYLAVQKLARTSLGLLLLTATPEQLGQASHFARLQLLDPDRYYDLGTFLREEAGYQSLNQSVQQLLTAQDPTELPAGLDSLVPQALLQQWCEAEANAREPLTQSLVDTLLDRHGTGRVLFRNTRQAVEGFPVRRVHPILLEQSDVDGDQGADENARRAWLSQWLRQHPRQKVLVICSKAEMALALEQYLRFEEGFAVSAFHEGLSLVARDRAAAYFADPEQGAQALICSEIGSEGRNFQFASHLVMFDLPDNPDLLEQRIGRLDRIGQRNDVNIWVPLLRGSAQERLYHWYHQGLNAFEQVCHFGAAIYQQFGAELARQLVKSDGDWSDFIARTAAAAQLLREKLEAGRDRLLELNSCRAERADEIIEALLAQEQRVQLEHYMGQVFDAYGVDQEPHSSVSLVLHPSDHMQCAHFPCLPDDGVTVTFQREMALSREDVEFLTWEHPMVTGAMDMVLSGGFGNTAVATIKLGPLKPGTLLLEAVFMLNVAAPAHLQLFRYLPLTPLRVLVDLQGRDLTDVLTAEKLQPLLQKLPRNTAQQIVKQARDAIGGLIDKAKAGVEPRRTALLAQAQAAVQSKLGEEISRLQDLAKVNPAIRAAEIDKLTADRTALQQFLSTASLKLDALRVILAT